MTTRLAVATTLALALFASACGGAAQTPAAPAAAAPAAAATTTTTTGATGTTGSVNTPSKTDAPKAAPTTAATTQSNSGSPLDALLAKIKGSKTLHLSGTYTLNLAADDPTSAPIALKMEGDVDLGAQNSRIKSTLGEGADAISTQTITIGDSSWTKVEGLSDWIKSEGAAEDLKQYDPKATLEDVLAGSDIVSESRENLNGVSTTHYKLAYNAVKANAAALKQDALAAAMANALASGLESSSDLWVDGSGNLLRQKLNATVLFLGSKMTTTIDMTYSNYGKTISPPITPPAP